MTLEERIAANAEKGYVYVGTGYDVGCLPIWNTLRSSELLKLIIEGLK